MRKILVIYVSYIIAPRNPYLILSHEILKWTVSPVQGLCSFKAAGHAFLVAPILFKICMRAGTTRTSTLLKGF